MTITLLMHQCVSSMEPDLIMLFRYVGSVVLKSKSRGPSPKGHQINRREEKPNIYIYLRCYLESNGYFKPSGPQLRRLHGTSEKS